MKEGKTLGFTVALTEQLEILTTNFTPSSTFVFYLIIKAIFSINSSGLLLYWRLHGPKAYVSCHYGSTSPVTVKKGSETRLEDKLLPIFIGKVGKNVK